MAKFLFLLVLIILMLFQTPIPVAVFASVAVGMFMNGRDLASSSFVTANAINSFTMMAVPFFILAGNLMGSGSITTEILDVAQKFAGGKRTAIGTATIVASAFFAAISGSAVVTIAALGSITIPMMIKQGYKPEFACAVAAAGAVVGPIIPPSLLMVLYGVTAQVSISELFMAGVIPGLMVSLAFYITMRFMARKNIDYDMPVEGLRKYSFKEKMLSLWHGKWSLLMPIIVLGGIYAGVFTPTEAAIIACDYAILVGLVIKRDTKLKDILGAMKISLGTLGAIMILIGVTSAFGQVLTLNMVPQAFTNAVVSLTTNKYIILLLVLMIGMIIGCFMEGSTSTLILTPILLPLVTACGLTPLQFGVIMAVVLSYGAITPPFGLNLFVASNVTGVPVLTVAKKCGWFVLSAIIVLILITFIPQIISFLPDVLK